MKDSREKIIDILLKSYTAYYDITDYGTSREPLRALCEYYEHAEKYMVSKKVSLWAADSEEFKLATTTSSGGLLLALIRAVCVLA